MLSEKLRQSMKENKHSINLILIHTLRSVAPCCIMEPNFQEMARTSTAFILNHYLQFHGADHFHGIPTVGSDISRKIFDFLGSSCSKLPMFLPVPFTLTSPLSCGC